MVYFDFEVMAHYIADSYKKRKSSTYDVILMCCRYFQFNCNVCSHILIYVPTYFDEYTYKVNGFQMYCKNINLASSIIAIQNKKMKV